MEKEKRNRRYYNLPGHSRPLSGFLSKPSSRGEGAVLRRYELVSNQSERAAR